MRVPLAGGLRLAGGRRGASEPRRALVRPACDSERAPWGASYPSGVLGVLGVRRFLLPGGAGLGAFPRLCPAAWILAGTSESVPSPYPRDLVLQVCPSDCKASSCKSLSRRHPGLPGSLSSFGEEASAAALSELGVLFENYPDG